MRTNTWRGFACGRCLAGACAAGMLLTAVGCIAASDRLGGQALEQAIEQVQRQRLAEAKRAGGAAGRQDGLQAGSQRAGGDWRSGASRSAGLSSFVPLFDAPDVPPRPGDGLRRADYLTLVSYRGEEAAQAGPGQGTEAAIPERAPLPTFGQTLRRDLTQMPARLWSDTKRTCWDAPNAIILLTAGGASLALRPEVDDDFEDKFDRARALRPEWGDVGGAVSNPATHFALAGAWYLVGAVGQDAQTYQVGKTLFSALIINGVSTMLLKTAAWTDSPNGESLAWPSGHTSSIVCFAAVMDEAYGPVVGWPLYAVAGFGGFTRMDDREHHFSDIVFGAALGWVVGHSVATGHRAEIFGGQIVPYADPTTGAAGLLWAKSFK